MIVVVGNSPTPVRDFSEEVASARLVVRVNKMDNIHTGLTGTRCDWYAMVPSIPCWNALKERNLTHIPRNARKVWLRSKTALFPDEVEEAIKTFKDVEPIPTECYASIPLYFTDSRITSLCLALFPDEQVHLVGVDTGRKLRLNRKESIGQAEIEWKRKMMKHGRLLIN